MSSQVSSFPTLSGRQEPHHQSVTPGSYERGEKALELARRMGQKPMPWQEWCVKQILSTNQAGMWTHGDAVLIIPRQNGKSWVLSVVIIYYIFVLRRNVIFTAQRWPTAEDIWKRTWAMVDAVPSLRKLVQRKTCSQGRGTIELRKRPGEEEGPNVIMTTRSADLGRGLTRKDLIIYDEAYNLQGSETSALDATQLAAEDPQTIYSSSAVNASEHFYGEILTGQRERGLAGDDPSMFFAEWMAPEEMPRDELETWQYANPSFGVIQNERKVNSLLQKARTPDRIRSFEVEILGRGDWPALGEAAHEAIIDPDVWAGLHDPEPDIVGDCAFSVDVTPDAVKVGMVSASRTRDGLHLSVAPVEDFDRQRVIRMSGEAVKRNDPVAVAIDTAGPASIIESELRRTGIAPEKMGPSRVTAACELFLQLVAEGKVTHDGNPRLAEAVAVAEFRDVKGEMGRALTRRSGDISTLVAATFAAWALTEYEIPLTAPARAKGQKRYVGTAKPVGGGVALSKAF